MNEAGFKEFLDADEEKKNEILSVLTQHKLKALSKAINRCKAEQYRCGGPAKYGNLRRVFYKNELWDFFKAITSEKVKHCFLVQFFYGLRIGEISSVQHDDKAGRLRIQNSKCRRTDYMVVHGKTKDLLRYLEEYQTLSSAYLRKAFRSICNDIGLDYVYMQDERGFNRYQFTTHSLRKTAITMFGEEVGAESLKIKEFARHSKSRDVTRLYYHYHDEEYRRDLENAFTDFYNLI